MDDIVIRALTRADLETLESPNMRDTCHGFAVELNGELVGVAGVARMRSMFLAFSTFTEKALATHKRKIWLTAQVLWGKIKALGYKHLYAFANPDLPGAPALLKRLGFTHIESSARGELFQWVS